MSFKIQKNIHNYLSAGARSGVLLGIFLWLVEISVILWKARSVVQLFSEDNIVWQLLIAAIIYALIGSLVGVILGLAIYVIQTLNSQRTKKTLSSYSACIGGLLFSFITLINIYYIWFPQILKKSIIIKSIVVLIVGLFALLIAYLIYYSKKKKFGKLLCLNLRAGMGIFKKRSTIYLLLPILIFVLVLFLLTNIEENNSDVLKNGNSPKSAAPSIILILVDTFRADHLSCLGHPDLITPNIDRLAKNSVLFTNAYTQAPWTRPSVATLLTALYPSSHGVNIGSKMKMKGYPGRMILSKEALTLPEYLKESGYYTAGFTTNPTIGANFGFAQGYDEYHFLDRPIINRFSLFEWLSVVFDIYLKNNFYVNAQTLVDRVSAWLATNKKSPFFLYLHFMDPHRPYFHEPENLWTKTDTDYEQELVKQNKESYQNDYRAEIAFADYHIGKLLEHIQNMGIYDNAVIVLTADHGEEFLEHGRWDHGHTLYEELLRVPLIIKLPNSTKGRIDHRLVRLMDLFPTILKILGLDIPVGLQGEPIIGPKGQPLESPSYIFAERLPTGKGDQAIRTRQWKFILSHDSNSSGIQKSELYDIRNDPEEKNDLSSTKKALVIKFRSKIDGILRYASERSIKPEKGSISEEIKKQLKTLGYIK